MDNYYVFDNETKEEKKIGNKEEFIEYINFYLEYIHREKVFTIKKAMNCFNKFFSGGEVGVGLEVIIRED